MTGGTGGNTTLLATIVSIDPIRFEFTFDEASFLRYERLGKEGKDIASRSAGVEVAVKLIDEPEFAHTGRMDFVDNMIERASGTIRGRAVLAKPNGVFTPGMFGARARARLAALRGAAGAGRRDRLRAGAQIRAGGRCRERRADQNTSRSASWSATCASSRTASRPDDRVIVNGLMRARPGAKVDAAGAGRAAPRRRPAGEDELERRDDDDISHFFIDRPIFASVLSIVFIILGGVSFIRLPIAQYPEIAPPIINVSGQYPGANAEVVATTVVAPIEEQINGVENMLYMSSNATADGRFSIAVTFDIGTNLDIAQVQVQNRVGIAQPRLPADVRKIGVTVDQVLARPDDGRAPVSRPTSRATRCSSPTTPRSRSRTR